MSGPDYRRLCDLCGKSMRNGVYAAHRRSFVCLMGQERRYAESLGLVHVPWNNGRRLLEQLREIGVEGRMLAVSDEPGYMGTIDKPRRGVHVEAHLAPIIVDAMWMGTMEGPVVRENWTLWAKVCLARLAR